jgi:hypothetical protein
VKFFFQLSSFRGEDFFKFHPPFFLICIIGQNRQKFKVHKKSCNICQKAHHYACTVQIWGNLKKSSPLKLLSQSQPNFAEMILGWPPSKLCPVIPTSNQDGRQAQNRKKGG